MEMSWVVGKNWEKKCESRVAWCVELSNVEVIGSQGKKKEVVPKLEEMVFLEIMSNN